MVDAKYRARLYNTTATIQGNLIALQTWRFRSKVSQCNAVCQRVRRYARIVDGLTVDVPLALYRTDILLAYLARISGNRICPRDDNLVDRNIRCCAAIIFDRQQPAIRIEERNFIQVIDVIVAWNQV